MLQHWRSTKRGEATKGAILKALEECRYYEQVETLAKKWNISLKFHGRQFNKTKQTNKQTSKLVTIYLRSGELHPKPKLNMFCVLSQNYQLFLKISISIINQIV